MTVTLSHDQAYPIPTCVDFVMLTYIYPNHVIEENVAMKYHPMLQDNADYMDVISCH